MRRRSNYGTDRIISISSSTSSIEASSTSSIEAPNSSSQKQSLQAFG
jgi:hypothetical protein